MDARTLRLAIVSMVSALLLIGVIVYAANADRVGELLSGMSHKGTSEVSEDVYSDTDEVTAQTPLGEQIGDNLKGFQLDADFFDRGESSSSVIVTTVDKPPAYPILEDPLPDPFDVERPEEDTEPEGVSPAGPEPGGEAPADMPEPEGGEHTNG